MIAERPCLSIVTVVKDDLPGLRRTRSSLSDQDMESAEWVLLDSSDERDGVERLLNEAAVAARYEWTEPRGVYPAMNSALSICRGDYVWFVNAGDEVASGPTVESLVARLKREAPLWLIGQVAFVDPRGHRVVPPAFDYSAEKRHLFARGRFAPHQGTLVRTDWLRENDGFDTSYRVAADYEASLRLSLVANPVVVDDVISEFHTGGLSSTEWQAALQEFHRSRRSVLRPTGSAALLETFHTWSQALRARSARALRRG